MDINRLLPNHNHICQQFSVKLVDFTIKWIQQRLEAGDTNEDIGDDNIWRYTLRHNIRRMGIQWKTNKQIKFFRLDYNRNQIKYPGVYNQDQYEFILGIKNGLLHGIATEAITSKISQVCVYCFFVCPVTITLKSTTNKTASSVTTAIKWGCCW